MTNLLQRIPMLAIVLLFHLTGFAQVPTAQKLDPNMTLQKAEDDGIIWLDPRKEPFKLSGFEWIQDDDVYRRLPVMPDWEIRDAVDQLANHTAGGQIRFRSNSKKILIRVELREKSGMYHMPATGQSGFDLYLKDGDVHRYVRTTRFPADTIRYQVELLNTDEKQMRDFHP